MSFLRTLLSFWNSGIPVTKEIYALVREILLALLSLWTEASPDDRDSPSTLTGKEIVYGIATHLGGKLLPPAQ